jgi:hypothetical protein
MARGGGLRVAGLAERGLEEAGLSHTDLDAIWAAGGASELEAIYAPARASLAVGQGYWQEIAMRGFIARLTVLAVSERYEERGQRVRGRREARDYGGEIDLDCDMGLYRLCRRRAGWTTPCNI